MFTYNDIDLDNTILSFTERDNGIEFYIEGYDEDKKICIDFIVSLKIDDLKIMELDYEYDLSNQLIKGETFLGIDNEFESTNIDVSLMKDIDEKYYLRVVNDTIDASVTFELEEKEEEEDV